MIQFNTGLDCHWTYRVGAYTSFYLWATQQEAVDALGDKEGEVFAKHGLACTCETTINEVTT